MTFPAVVKIKKKGCPASFRTALAAVLFFTYGGGKCWVYRGVNDIPYILVFI
jgi:hypothetical protein